MNIAELDFQSITFERFLNKDGVAQCLLDDASPIPLFREALKEGDGLLVRYFRKGVPAQYLVPQRATLIDGLLRQAWKIHFHDEDPDISLVAVGGYGRGELHPYSDVDILVLISDGARERFGGEVEHFITFLWDIGIEVGHSVRTLEECIEQATQDITIATNLTEARLLVGSEPLFDRLGESVGPDRIWDSRAFFEAKSHEQEARYHKYHDTAYNLEPNVKEGPGGLRDIQMIGWVAKRHFGAQNLHDLVDHGFLTEAEHVELLAGQYFLWEVRFLLHILTRRKEERLLFDHQRKIAEHFGYRGDDHRQSVENLMKRYYRHIMELQRLNEMLLQLFQEAILYSDDNAEPVPINRRFQARKGFIEVNADDVFVRYPFALLEVFLLLQQHPTLKGIRASTIRLIREARERMDDEFRNDLRSRSLFMEILRQPQGITHALRGLNRNGILAAYLPPFERIVGQMQYDLFHIYTVDEHTLKVVRNLRRFTVPAHFHEFPLCSTVAQRIPKLELLYLAGLFHDIAKGRNGDHSRLGAEDARTFCTDHHLSQRDTDLVIWLVENHLLMSTTAQRMDISDPEVVNHFAKQVGDQIRLDYLYLLTVADIRSTNPEIWNSWKHSLLQELYHITSRALRRGVDHPLDREERIRGVKWLARNLLGDLGLNYGVIRSVWDRLGDEYFLRYSAEEIAWHTEAIAATNEQALPLVLARQEPKRGSSAVFIYSKDMDNFFARVTSLLDQMHLSIVDARIITSYDDYTFDTYLLLEETNDPISSPERLEYIQNELHRELAEADWDATPSRKRVPRQLRHFPMTTEINFSQDEPSGRTVLELITADRPGLLSRVGLAFAELGLQLENAKITTLVNRAEDVFFVTDLEGNPITEEAEFERIRTVLLKYLSDQRDSQTPEVIPV